MSTPLDGLHIELRYPRTNSNPLFPGFNCYLHAVGTGRAAKHALMDRLTVELDAAFPSPGRSHKRRGGSSEIHLATTTPSPIVDFTDPRAVVAELADIVSKQGVAFQALEAIDWFAEAELGHHNAGHYDVMADPALREADFALIRPLWAAELPRFLTDHDRFGVRDPETLIAAHLDTTALEFLLLREVLQRTNTSVDRIPLPTFGQGSPAIDAAMEAVEGLVRSDYLVTNGELVQPGAFVFGRRGRRARTLSADLLLRA